MNVTFRPIDRWPADAEPPAHLVSPFSAGWGSTLELLDRELHNLRAERVVVQLALDETEIRLDGWPRADARPKHPGVILAFDSVHGPLKYVTTRFTKWEDNLRAIALGLESLRRVDRYGITRRGEQYTGWRALPTGESMSVDEAREIVDGYGGVTAALKATHPDHGGDRDEFERVQAAREVLAG